MSNTCNPSPPPHCPIESCNPLYDRLFFFSFLLPLGACFDGSGWTKQREREKNRWQVIIPLTSSFTNTVARLRA